MTNQLEALISGIRKRHHPKALYAPVITWDEMQSLIAALEQSQQRVAELEARQLAVKPPEQYPDDGELSFCIDLYDEPEGDLRLAMWLKELRRRRTISIDPLAVKLPKRSVGEVMHMSGFSRDYAEGWCAGNDNAIHEIRAAGGTVQGDE